MTLNEEQLRAVAHPIGKPACLIAGAGSGKTAIGDNTMVIKRGDKIKIVKELEPWRTMFPERHGQTGVVLDIQPVFIPSTPPTTQQLFSVQLDKSKKVTLFKREELEWVGTSDGGLPDLQFG